MNCGWWVYKYIRQRPECSLWGNRVWDRAANISKEKKWSYLFSVNRGRGKVSTKSVKGCCQMSRTSTHNGDWWKRIVWLLKKIQIQGKHPKLKNKRVTRLQKQSKKLSLPLQIWGHASVYSLLHPPPMRPRLEVRGRSLGEDGEGQPHQSGRGRQFHGLAVMVSINILMGSVVCPIIHCRWNGWMNEWGGLISWSVVCSQCNTFLLQYLTGTSARTWLKTKDSKLTWPTATDSLLFLSDILRDVHWILEDQTLQLWIHIYILWGKDLAAGAEGAVKYWRLLRGNPNIALLFNLRLFFLLLTHLNFF